MLLLGYLLTNEVINEATRDRREVVPSLEIFLRNNSSNLEISIRRSSNGGSIIPEKLSLVVNYGVSCFDKPRLEALKPVSLERRRRLASHTHTHAHLLTAPHRLQVWNHRMPDTIFKYVKSVTNEGKERKKGSNGTGQIVEASMHSNPSGSFFLFGTAPIL